MTVIKTALGRYFPLDSPEDFEYRIEEIAWHLAHINRFTGAARVPISVAYHSVMVSMGVPRHLALEGLMHDAEEAFYGDVSSPLKRLIGVKYKRLATRCQRAIRAQFGLPLDEDPAIKERDLQRLRFENLVHMPDAVQKHPEGFPPHKALTRVPSLVAGLRRRVNPAVTSGAYTADLFLLRYYELVAGEQPSEELFDYD